MVPLLDLLPPREADMIQMYFVDHKRQVDIAYIFELTQAAVSYRLARAAERLRFLISIPQIPDDEIVELLEIANFKRRDISILLLYRELSSQSRVAERLGMEQSNARHRIFEAVKRLNKLAARDPRYRDIAKLYTMQTEAGCILHNVKSPRWKGRGEKPRDDTFG